MQYTLFHFLMTELRLKVKAWLNDAKGHIPSKFQSGRRNSSVLRFLPPSFFSTVKQLEFLLGGNNLPLFLLTYLFIFWICEYVPGTVFCLLTFYFLLEWGFPGGSDGKAFACNAGDPGSIPGSGRSPWSKEWNVLLQYSCLQKNPMDRGAWRATVQGLAKSWTGLSE